MSDTLLISTPTELLRLPAKNILFISSNGKRQNDKRQKNGRHPDDRHKT